jgi:hypothetical protein
MSKIILVTGFFQKYGRDGQELVGQTEFLTSHGIDVDTGKTVIVQSEHPKSLGAKFDYEIGEWVLEDDK